MRSHSKSKTNPLRWLKARKPVVVVTAVALLVLAFQLNTLLSSSFRIEILGVEIFEVRQLDAPRHAPPAPDRPVLRPRPVPRAPLPPVPPAPLPPTPEGVTHIYTVVEEMPELIGGLRALQRAIRYPVMAKNAGIEGRVLVQFVVNERGWVSESKIVRGIGGGCDEEALRALQTMRFRPGKQRGKPVQVKMTLPITFKLAP